jgi:hypothetical protein
MSINALIQQITPLYNEYRSNKSNLSGTEALEIMWEIGDFLKEYIEQNKIAPHNLFWSVYGNAEGTKNIAPKSYITREFQSRCHRIRKIFINKEQIRQDFPSLRTFTTFREAMPFFDEGKYKLRNNDRSDLLTLLNSNQQPKIILEKIKNLQRQRIGVNNPRTQRLHEVENEKQIFINFYNYIYSFIKQSNYKPCLAEINNVGIEHVKTLSKNVSALSQEGLKFYSFDLPADLKSPWQEFCAAVNNLMSQKDAKNRRRFRRLIPSERIVRLADLLYGLLSEDNFNNFKKRL